MGHWGCLILFFFWRIKTLTLNLWQTEVIDWIHLELYMVLLDLEVGAFAITVSIHIIGQYIKNWPSQRLESVSPFKKGSLVLMVLMEELLE